jgi:hypothetical protein
MNRREYGTCELATLKIDAFSPALDQSIEGIEEVGAL